MSKGKELLEGLFDHVEVKDLDTVLGSLFKRALPVVGEDKSIIVIEVLDEKRNMNVTGYAHKGNLTEEGKKHLQKHEPIPREKGLIWQMIESEVSGITPTWMEKDMYGSSYTVTDMDLVKEYFIPIIADTKAVQLVPIYFGLASDYLVGGMAIDSKDEKAFQDLKVVDFLAMLGRLLGFLLESYYRKFHDPVLGLDIRIFHRGYLMEFLSAQLDKRSTDGKLYVCLFDINEFRKINNDHGHIAGDKTIEYFSKCLQLQSDAYRERKHKVVLPFRYGGDEFVIVKNADLEEEVRDFVKEMDRHLKNIPDSVKKYFKSSDISINFSVGITDDKGLSPSKDKEKTSQYVDLLMKEADEMMYKAKKYFREKNIDRAVLCFKNGNPEHIGP